MVPGVSEIEALHRELAPSATAFELVWTHCQIVWAVASQVIERRDLIVDVELVRAGCLLHDIGVHALGDAAYIRHGILGEALLRERGFPYALCRFCSHHTGVGLTREDVVRQRLPLPAADYLAETAEERLVMYADKFHSKTTPPVFLRAATYRAQLRRFGPDNETRFDKLVQDYGEPNLNDLAAQYRNALT
jgi:uncharacterized protein